MTVTIEDVRAAAAILEGAVLRTPMRASPLLSERLGCDVFLKFENLQHTGSFKVRGALNKLVALDAAARARGIIAMSAGNHAQGVAYHANRLGIPATIVMPHGTPNLKVRQTRALGATVALHGDSLDESAVLADRLAAEQGLTFIHPYDDPAIIAGQGTVGLEMLDQIGDLDTLVVPIGGGGLISGIATAAKALAPSIRIIGVQSALYPAMAQVLRGEAIACTGQSIAEGIAVKQPGRLTRAIVEALVDEVLLVPDSAIERAIGALIEIEKTVVEGAGAAGLALALDQPGRFAGRRVGFVLAGGNIDPRMLSAVLMRGLLRDGRIARMRIEIPDRPGVLAEIAGIIGADDANILEVAHHRLFTDVPAKLAELDIVIECRDHEHVASVERALADRGYGVRHLTGVLGSG